MSMLTNINHEQLNGEYRDLYCAEGNKIIYRYWKDDEDEPYKEDYIGIGTMFHSHLEGKYFVRIHLDTGRTFEAVGVDPMFLYRDIDHKRSSMYCGVPSYIECACTG